MRFWLHWFAASFATPISLAVPVITVTAPATTVAAAASTVAAWACFRSTVSGVPVHHSGRHPHS